MTFKEWDALRDQMPFRALPVLEVDGRVLAQSNSINRYVGKLAGLPFPAALRSQIGKSSS